jgi:hypothetical protein
VATFGDVNDDLPNAKLHLSFSIDQSATNVAINYQPLNQDDQPQGAPVPLNLDHENPGDYSSGMHQQTWDYGPDTHFRRVRLSVEVGSRLTDEIPRQGIGNDKRRSWTYRFLLPRRTVKSPISSSDQ